MRLVDTSVWVDHLSREDLGVENLLRQDDVLMHPFVLGEIALGNLPRRAETLFLLRKVEPATTAATDHVLDLIERERLSGLGIGYVDAHLSASVFLTPGAVLWTRDRRLHAAAERLRVAA